MCSRYLGCVERLRRLGVQLDGVLRRLLGDVGLLGELRWIGLSVDRGTGVQELGCLW
jgi:hypothetical protein